MRVPRFLRPALARMIPDEIALAEARGAKDAATYKAFAEVMKGSNYFDNWGNTVAPYDDPSKVVDQKTRAIFREMMDMDDMVANAVNLRTLAALSSGWEVLPASEDPADIEAADLATFQMYELEGSPNSSLLGMKDSLGMGFSMGEKVWGKVKEDGEWRGKQFLHKIAYRNPVYVVFKLDMHDQIEPDGIWQVETIGSQVPIARLSLDQVVYQAHDPRDGNPYGRPPATRAYQWYFFKTGAVKLWGRTMERFGVPVAVGSIPDPAGEGKTKAQDAEVALFKSFLSELRSSLYAVKYDSWDIDFKEIRTGTSQLFKDAIDKSNRGIARAFGLPELVGETSSSGGGAYALGKEHRDTLTWIIDYDREVDEDTWQRSVIEPVVRHNLPVEQMPQFRFKSYKQDDLMMLANTAKVLLEIGMPLSVEGLAERFPDFPLAEEGEERLVMKKSDNPFSPDKTGMGGEEGEREFTDIVLDWAAGKLGAPKVYSFAASTDEAKAREKKGDALGDNRGANIEESIAQELWGTSVGSELAVAAETIEGQVGKGNGARPRE